MPALALGTLIGACAILSDEGGRICAATPEVLPIFGWEPAELVGRAISSLIPAAATTGFVSGFVATGENFVKCASRDSRTFESQVCVEDIELAGESFKVWIVCGSREIEQSESKRRRLARELEETRELAHAGHWYQELGTGKVEWSDSVFRILGLMPGSVEPDRALLLTFVDPTDRAGLECAFERGERDHTAFSLEVRIHRADDAARIIRVSGRVIPDQVGEGAWLTGMIQDVTARHDSDRAITMLTSAVEQTADHVMITRRDGMIEYVNPAFERSSGFARDEVIGTNPRFLKSGRHDDAFYGCLWDAILAGRPFRDTFINKRKNGEIYYEDKTISPILGAHGEITQFVATGKDITPQRIAAELEERLVASLKGAARQWRLTFDSIDKPIVIADGAGVIRRVNVAAQRLSGRGFEDLLGLRLSELPARQPWGGMREILSLESAGEMLREFDQSDGQCWEITGHWYEDEGRQILFIARDVTRLRQLQETVKRNEMMAALGRLVAGVAHEVRNPLFAVSATIDAFDGQSLDSQMACEFVGRLRAEVARLSGLMEDLLQYGRPQEPVLRFGDLCEAIRASARTVELLLAERLVTLELSLGGEPATVLLDPPRMQQVFRNLLENSIQHTPPRGRVAVELRQTDGLADCVITDDGPGFREEDIPHVFEPFFTRRRGGTGLGLAIVKRLIEEHHGTVSIRNRPGGGAEVHVMLPVEELRRGAVELVPEGEQQEVHR